MVLILIASAVLSAIFEDLKSTIVLLVVVLVNVAIGFTQEYKAERSLTNLLSSRVAQQKATVIRDGHVTDISASDVVVSDIVLLEEGDQVPADMRLIEVSHLQIDESILTGESAPVEKSAERMKKRNIPLGDQTNMARLTTMVVRGKGKGLVVAVGLETEVGKNSKELMSRSSRKKTNLQSKLSTLGRWLVLLAIVLCGIFTLVGYLRGYPLDEIIRVGVSLAVSVIPEGLVAVTTVTMALGCQRMAKNQAIVRQLPAVEVLGSVSIICSDKTGTLTEGKMKAERLWCASSSDKKGIDFYFHGPGNVPIGGLYFDREYTQKVEQQNFPSTLTQMMIVCSLCNGASVYFASANTPKKPTTPSTPKVTQQGVKSQSFFEKDLLKGEKTFLLPKKETPNTLQKRGIFDWKAKAKPQVIEEEKSQYVGTPTDVALEISAMKVGMGKDDLMNNSQTRWKFVREIPFDSERKRMCVAYQTSNSEMFVLAKGALEFLLPLCSTWLKGENDATAEVITDKDREDISNKAKELAGIGMRVLALANKRVSDLRLNGSSSEELDKEMESDLCFLGLTGLRDPPREQVSKSIIECHKAHISVCMVTGDHPSTALYVAKQLGLVPKEINETDDFENESNKKYVMTGIQVDELSDDDLVALDPFPSVFARSSPDTKLRVVKALQAKNKIVAFIGDGVNDASSIRHSDVGVSMGKTGTDLSQQCADIILSDDNFEHIVTAIEEGRRIYDNIFKFTAYLLSCNSAEIFTLLILTALDAPLPFTAIQILFANIIADVPPSLSIGLEPAEKDTMNRLPRNPKEKFFPWYCALVVALQGLGMSGICILGFYSAVYWETYSLPHARCLAFAMLVFVQLIHAFLSRSFFYSIFQTGVLGNKWMIGMVFFSAVCLVGGLYIPVLSDVLDLVPLGWLDWGKIAIAAFIHVIFVELMKVFLRWRKNRRGLGQFNNNNFDPV